MARIRCLAERTDGTVINFDDGPRRGYHFKPSATCPDHVAEVTNPVHVQRLLSIPEGFALVDGEKIPAGIVLQKPKSEPVPGAPAEPESLSNRELMLWAKDHGIANHQSLEAIRDFASVHHVDLVDVPTKWNEMVRALAKALP